MCLLLILLQHKDGTVVFVACPTYVTSIKMMRQMHLLLVPHVLLQHKDGTVVFVACPTCYFNKNDETAAFIACSTCVAATQGWDGCVCCLSHMLLQQK